MPQSPLDAIQAEALIIEKIEKPYSVGGNSGISYKVRFLHSTSVFKVKVTKEQFDKITLGGNYKLILKLDANLEEPRVQIVSFDLKK